MSLNTYTELRKKFIRNYLDFIVLQMLINEPLWGYKIMSLMRAKYDIKIGPSVIYPLLDSLQEKELIKFKERDAGNRKRKIYIVTSHGIEKVKNHSAVLREFLGSSL